MKKPLAFKLVVDPKDVRRAVAILTGEALSDEELDARFFEKQDAEIEAPEDQEFEMTLMFVAFMVAEEMGYEIKEERIKGKFARKMEEMMKAKKN